MGNLKVCIFVSVDQSGESHKRIREAGCELYIEEKMRQIIADNNEDYRLRPDADTSALVGVATRPIPITSDVMRRFKRFIW